MSLDASIIVVSYNTRALTLACLASIRAFCSEFTYEVIVVDNGSTDGSADAIADACPWATLIRAGKNLGFSGGVNAGLAVNDSEFVILFNSDAYLIENAFAGLVAYARAHPDAGGVGGKVVNDDRSHQPTAARFPHLWLDFSDHVLRPLRVVPASWQVNCVDPTDYDAPVETDWLSGSAVLYRRAAIMAAGGIDNDFFLGEEDIDLGFRLKRAGWHVMYVPVPGVVHLGGRSRALSAASAAYFFGGRYLFYKKHRSRQYARRFRAILLAAYGLRWCIARMRVLVSNTPAHRQTLTRYAEYVQAIRRCD